MNPKRELGYYKGRHYSTWVSDIENLKKSGKLEDVEMILLQLVSATEEEASFMEEGIVAPWYYEELAKIYRKQKDYAKEVAILEKYVEQPHGGVKAAQLMERLSKTAVGEGFIQSEALFWLASFSKPNPTRFERGRVLITPKILQMDGSHIWRSLWKFIYPLRLVISMTLGN